MQEAIDVPRRKSVLVVDDTPDNLALMAGLLREHYRVQLANSGDKALRLVRGGQPPDIILLDIMMPGMSGHEVCRQLKADEQLRSIPVIFLTAMSSLEDEELGLRLGAVDYITKPISPPIVLARVRAHLQNKEAADYLRDQSMFLRAEVERQTQLVRAVQDATVMALASLAETRDNETGNHIRRTQFYVRALACCLSGKPRFRDQLTPQAIELMFKTAPLHDIGKVGIPDSILLKPGPLSAEEFAIMKTHTSLGREAIERARVMLEVPVDFLGVASDIAYFHHEKWDGSGYPEGLVGDAIPLAARLMALADVYDALISRRVYKLAMPHAQAAAILREGAGRHFDPDVVAAFDAVEHEFQAIAKRYRDDEDAHAAA